MNNYENIFGRTLRQILTQYELTYANIASILNYDESYISKWVNGRVFPSEANLEKIIDGIIHSVCERLEIEYQDIEHDNSDIGVEVQDIRTRLTEAYYVEAGKKSQKPVSESAQEQNYYPVGDLLSIATNIRRQLFSKQNQESVLELIDIFSINNDSRLLLAGVVDGHFVIEENQTVHLDMVVDFSQVKDFIYDLGFLIHMMTSLSAVNFTLYSNDLARGKMISVSDNTRSISANVINEVEGISIIEDSSTSQSHLLYEKLLRYCTQESMTFKKINQEEWIDNHLYLQSLFSAKQDWIIGHYMEHFIPPDLSDVLMERLMESCSEDYIRELKQIQLVRSNVYNSINVRIIFYKVAITNFIITGEVDFYNHKILMSVEERLQCIEYMIKLLQQSQIKFSMIIGNLNPDFEYLAEPCVFLSDRISFLRLANNLYRNNFLIVKDVNVTDYFNEFYNEIWNNRLDIVENRQEGILHYLNDSLQKLMLLKT